jgi:hypothetical protein
MNRQLTNFDEASGWWRYIIEYRGETFIQVVQRSPETGQLDTWAGRLSYIPEGDDEWHEVLHMLRWSGEPYPTTLDEAIEMGDALIRQWEPGDPPAPPPHPRQSE